jgi:putative flippase GtrA
MSEQAERTESSGTADPGPPVASAPRVGLPQRFGRYASLSLITVPAGYAVLLTARHLWDVNAGLLNLAVGTLLTPPSFLLYRTLVWRDVARRPLIVELFSFWQTVMVGAVVAGSCIAVADHLRPGNPVAIVAAGLTGQFLVFVARFFWLDLVTFARHRRA